MKPWDERNLEVPQEMKITFSTLMIPERHEILEDEIRNFLEEKGVSAVIENEVTGNITRTREDDLIRYSVNVDYPSEIMEVEATSKEEAEEKALEMIGEVTINAPKNCTAEAEEVI